MKGENKIVINTVQLRKDYLNNRETVSAVSDISIDIKKGNVLLVKGPNGSGKTTLLSMLGCLINPTSGSLFILNTNVSQLSQNQLTTFRRKNIGFVFQSFRLIDSLTAIENIELIFDLSERNQLNSNKQAANLLDEMKMAHKSKLFPHALSSGEKQRIAIARAFANDPEIILADEPTGSLDSSMGKYTIELLCESARKRNNTVVIVSHDERIQNYADRILLMEDGRIIKEL